MPVMGLFSSPVTNTMGFPEAMPKASAWASNIC
jgi:hypothetical protein